MRVLYITSFIPKKNADQAGINVSFDIIKTIKQSIECKIDLIGLVNDNQYKIEDTNDVKEFLQLFDENYMCTSIIDRINK